MEKRRATNTYSAACALSFSLPFVCSPLPSPRRFYPGVRVHDPFLPICQFEHLCSSLVPSCRSFRASPSSSRSIPVSLSHRLIPPHFSVARPIYTFDLLSACCAAVIVLSLNPGFIMKLRRFLFLSLASLPFAIR